MFDLNGTLVSPDRKPIRLRDIAGSRGLFAVGVGRGAERGFQMAYRFSDMGERLASEGVNLAFVYPKESARHVMDPVSVASARFQRSLYLLLDAEGRFFRQPCPARSLLAMYLDDELELLDSTCIRLLDDTWDDSLRAFEASTRFRLPR